MAKRSCYCYKVITKPTNNPLVPVTPNSHPNFVVVLGNQFTYDGGNVGTRVTTITNATGATCFLNSINRTLVGAEFTYNVNGTFTINLGTQYTVDDVFTIFLNWT